MTKRRPEIDRILKETIDKIGSQVTDEVSWCQEHFKHIYNRVMDWGRIDTHYDDIEFSEAEQICKDKLCQIRYVINLRKQQASKGVSNAKV